MSKINSDPNYYHFILFPLLLIGTALIFLLLQPKVAAIVFSWKSNSLLQNFEAQVIKNDNIDPKSFWEFREFYSPGSFVVNKSGLTIKDIALIKNIFSTKGSFLPVITFKSQKIISLEALATSKNLSSYVNMPSGEILLNKPNQFVYKAGGYLFIEFILPISEMQKANGFFDYKGDDVSLLKNKYWLSMNRIAIN